MNKANIFIKYKKKVVNSSAFNIFLLYLHPTMKNSQIIIYLFSLVTLLFSCGNKAQKNETPPEDLQAKKTIQGIWVDELEGDCVLRAKGDTIYYADSLSEPVKFHILADTLYLESSQPTKYHLTRLTAHVLRFTNSNGDEISLTKSNDKSLLSIFEHDKFGSDKINQGQLIKRDSVLTDGGRHLHAYIQVNPTSYKVYHQSLNEDGVNVDHAFYDNIVHVALYDGARSIISRDYKKKDFAAYVPKEYIAQCILSDILIDKSTAEGANFIAILSAPDSYTSYHVNIFVCNNGKVKMSL